MAFLFRRLFSSAQTSPANMAATKQKVQQLIDDNKVVIFSKSYCPYCRQTKSTLDELNTDYTVLELDQIDDGSAIQDALQEITGQRSVPNSFIAQKHIGGNSDLQNLLKGGKLENLLKEAGALKA
ncbi:Glutaredoxin [Colletotrichum higginsianum IMI 349063]|uniref:Glutaredoxin n=4 Tax=Colletotrichum destructivum species complex TaxID=2707350 RepID=A0A1B7XWX7_COLHI|nr:Glutaredoxin [Colletotrichum higginsianum IMI 349063]OBR04244.1 Glutaredoxin [Colletotrichum higginsianum IMI 349063]WQF90086.1 Putative glutaredoxin, thioredoxin, Thioredoxin-like superfamily [Colletotrichum destructivum]